MIKIIEVTKLTFPGGKVDYTCVWQDTEKSRKATDDQFDGLIVGINPADAETLIKKSTRKEEGKGPGVERYLFD